MVFFKLFSMSPRLITQPRDRANRRPPRVYVSRGSNLFTAIHARPRRRSLILVSLGVATHPV
jgi:hypothetical protein